MLVFVYLLLCRVFVCTTSSWGWFGCLVCSLGCWLVVQVVTNRCGAGFDWHRWFLKRRRCRRRQQLKSGVNARIHVTNRGDSSKLYPVCVRLVDESPQNLGVSDLGVKQHAENVSLFVFDGLDALRGLRQHVKRGGRFDGEVV